MRSKRGCICPGGGARGLRGRASLWLGALLLLFPPSLARAADADRDALDDDWEQSYFGDLSATVAGDPDGDGLYNQQEEAFGSDPTRFDTDGDVLSDRRERDLGTNPRRRDTDADGLTDYAEVQLHRTRATVRDTDGGGRGDGEEVLVDGTDPRVREDDAQDSDGDGLPNYIEARIGTDPFSSDTDGDLLSDAEENPDLDDRYAGDKNENGVFEPELGEETDPTRADTDGDGLDDGLELIFGSDPFDTDSDDDGYSDGDEYDLRLTEHECLDPAEPDSDFDGVDDGSELDAGFDPCNSDSDGDGAPDGVELTQGTDPSSPDALPDNDQDGLGDAYEAEIGTDPSLADSDGDGLSDLEEAFPLTDRYVSDPLDADSDDDGILDGNEGGVAVGGAPRGGTSPVNPDSDDDGLSDGQERGLALPESSLLDPDATDLGLFVPDTDPGSVTDPLDTDTDGDGLADAGEDANGDGAVQATETDPRIFDSDGDGMDDGWETRYSPGGACPAGSTVFLDATDGADGESDIDADGLSNLAEYRLEVRVGLIVISSPTSPCDTDSDDDGLSDADEAFGSYQNGQTDPNLADTDQDGLGDGLEDGDHDGRFALTVETDPSSADSDGDGLRDEVEDANQNGAVDAGETDPRSFDTDGDGLGDGSETFQFGTDPLLPDSDADGIRDGVEVGVGDADPASVTDPLSVDTDGDERSDGVEDENADGRLDPNETDPTDYDTDDGGVPDGVEINLKATDPRDPSDDDPATGTSPPPPVIEMPPTDMPPDPTLPQPIEARWLLEPNAEIRGSAACDVSTRSMAVRAAPRAVALWPWLLLGLVMLRRRGARPAAAVSRGLGLVALIGSTLLPAVSGAQATPEQIANARNTNIDVNPHRLNPGGFDLLGTSRPRVLPHLGFRGAALLHHLAGPAVVADKDSGATLRRLVGNREEMTLGAALGVFDRYQVSVMLPLVLHQRAELPGQQLGTATASGFGSLTVVPRAVLLGGGGSAVRLGVELPVTVPLWETPAYMGYEGWGVEPRLLTEEVAGPLVFSVALGVLVKPEQRIFNLRDGDQLTYALAGMYPDAVQDWDFGLEFQGGTPLAHAGRSPETRGEVLLGARHRWSEQLSVTAGTGAGVMSGIGQASYRVFLAVGYNGSLSPASANEKPDCSQPPGAGGAPPGCPPPDTDGDGIPDVTDVCPRQAEDLDEFEDENGCPDPDNDADGRLDIDDGCPREPEDRDGFKDTDGCPEPDNDGDRVLDVDDKCPLQAEDFDDVSDEDGCPEGATVVCPDGVEPTPSGECLAHLEVGLIHIAEPIQFAEDTAKLMDKSLEILDQVVDILDAKPEIHLLIIGHTDGRGPAVINQHLSQLRANSVRWYLLAQSKDPNQLGRRIKSLGKGESEPVDDNETAVGRAKNRRVEFLVVDAKDTRGTASPPPPKPSAAPIEPAPPN